MENNKQEQERQAIVYRVLRGIEYAARFQDHDAMLATHRLLGGLRYRHFEGGVCYDLDTLIDRQEVSA